MADTAPGDAYGQDAFTAERGSARDVTTLASRLSTWFRKGAPAEPDATVTDVQVPGGGASSDLFLVSVAGVGDAPRRFAVRLAPAYAVYPVVDLEHQFALTRWAAEHSTAPVPAALWFEAAVDWLGAPFIVSAFAEGRVGGDVLGGWPLALSPAERRRLWERSIESLAALHACPLDDGVRRRVLPAPGATGVQRAVAYWQSYLRFVSEGDEFPLIERAVDVLAAEAPTDVQPDALVWGDARLGNMLFDGTTPTALLDFEFCHVGLREFDVAFFSFFDEILAVHFMGASRLEGYLRHDETLDHYEAVSGTPIRHRRYFTLMACTYSALAVTRVLQGRARGGYVDPSFVHRHGPMAALAGLLDASLDDA